MFPPATSRLKSAKHSRPPWQRRASVVVELERPALRQPWRYVRGAPRNRQITPNTRFTLTGPAAGSDLVKTAADRTGRRVSGTFGNCSGSTTPWDTVLSGEETSTATSRQLSRVRQPPLWAEKQAERLRLEAIDPRFDATQPDYAAEPHRFGYIVEIDPHDPESIPRKHTAWGGSSTRAPTSASMTTALWPRTWVMTRASSISTSSLPRRSTAEVPRLRRGAITSGYLPRATSTWPASVGPSSLGTTTSARVHGFR